MLNGKVPMTYFKQSLILVLFTTLFSLTGCGGGGGEKPSDNSSEPIYNPDTTDSPSPLFNPYANVINYPYYNNVQNTGADLWHNNNFTGEGSLVAVLDSGANLTGAKYDITANLPSKYTATYTRDFNDSSNDGYEVYDFDYLAQNNSNPHGDYMSQVIGSSEIGIGIAPNTNIMHLVISEDGYTDAASRWKGLESANNAGAVVANISFQYGGMYVYKGTEDEIKANSASYKHDITNKRIHDAIVSSGMAIINSAGNSNENVSDLVYSDASVNSFFDSEIKNNFIIAGALDYSNTQIADYSAYAGENPDVQARFLMAPGTSLVELSGTENGYVSGTSPAAASISGSIALMKSRWNNLTGAELGQILLDTASTDIVDYSPSIHGQGKLDLHAAYSPYGVTTIRTSTNESVPVYAASLQLPSGFKDQTTTTAMVDERNRDYEITLAYKAKAFDSRFNERFDMFLQNTSTVNVGHVDKFNINTSETFTGIERNSGATAYDSFTENMFNTYRPMESIQLSSDDLKIAVSANIKDQSQQLSNSINGLGFIADIDYKGLGFSIFNSNEDEGYSFYGAKERYSKGFQIRYLNGPFSLDTYVSDSSIRGTSLIKSMDNKKNGLTLSLNLLNGQTKGLKLGVLGRYSESFFNVKMNIPKSNGDGSLRYTDETINLRQELYGAGFYAQAGGFKLNAYSDKNNQSLMMSYKKQF